MMMRRSDMGDIDDDFQDGIDILSVYKNKKTTFSDSLEDDE